MGESRPVRVRDLVGRRIVSVELSTMDCSDHYGKGVVVDVVEAITLDNGRRVWFNAVETGNEPVPTARTKPLEKRRKENCDASQGR